MIFSSLWSILFTANWNNVSWCLADVWKISFWFHWCYILTCVRHRNYCQLYSINIAYRKENGLVLDKCIYYSDKNAGGALKDTVLFYVTFLNAKMLSTTHHSVSDSNHVIWAFVQVSIIQINHFGRGEKTLSRIFLLTLQKCILQ